MVRKVKKKGAAVKKKKGGRKKNGRVVATFDRLALESVARAHRAPLMEAVAPSSRYTTSGLLKTAAVTAAVLAAAVYGTHRIIQSRTRNQAKEAEYELLRLNNSAGYRAIDSRTSSEVPGVSDSMNARAQTLVFDAGNAVRARRTMQPVVERVALEPDFVDMSDELPPQGEIERLQPPARDLVLQEERLQRGREFHSAHKGRAVLAEYHAHAMLAEALRQERVEKARDELARIPSGEKLRGKWLKSANGLLGHIARVRTAVEAEEATERELWGRPRTDADLL